MGNECTLEALKEAHEHRMEANEQTQQEVKYNKSKPEMLMEVAYSLTPQPFTWERLVVEVARAYPSHFSLRGYPNLPDSNSVNTMLCGRKGLVGRGRLKKVGERVYEVTNRQ